MKLCVLKVIICLPLFLNAMKEDFNGKDLLNLDIRDNKKFYEFLDVSCEELAKDKIKLRHIMLKIKNTIRLYHPDKNIYDQEFNRKVVSQCFNIKEKIDKDIKRGCELQNKYSKSHDFETDTDNFFKEKFDKEAFDKYVEKIFKEYNFKHYSPENFKGHQEKQLLNVIRGIGNVDVDAVAVLGENFHKQQMTEIHQSIPYQRLHKLQNFYSSKNFENMTELKLDNIRDYLTLYSLWKGARFYKHERNQEEQMEVILKKMKQLDGNTLNIGKSSYAVASDFILDLPSELSSLIKRRKNIEKSMTSLYENLNKKISLKSLPTLSMESEILGYRVLKDYPQQFKQILHFKVDPESSEKTVLLKIRDLDKTIECEYGLQDKVKQKIEQQIAANKLKKYSFIGLGIAGIVGAVTYFYKKYIQQNTQNNIE